MDFNWCTTGERKGIRGWEPVNDLFIVNVKQLLTFILFFAEFSYICLINARLWSMFVFMFWIHVNKINHIVKKIYQSQNIMRHTYDKARVFIQQSKVSRKFTWDLLLSGGGKVGIYGSCIYEVGLGRKERGYLPLCFVNLL